MAGVVDGANARLGHEFTVDGFGFDEGLQGVEVGEFEVADAGVMGVFEEDGLAVAAVLFELSVFEKLL